MATLRDIRLRIKGIKSTAKITSAMKMVSTAKLKRAQNAIENARPYVVKLDKVIKNLVSSLGDEGYTHPLIRKVNDVKSIAIIVIGSDRGMCGSFNTNLFRDVVTFIKSDLNKNYPGAKIQIIPVGRKAASFFRKSGLPVIKEFPGVFNDLKYESAVDIVASFKSYFTDGEIDRVYIYNNKFFNMLKQSPERDIALPVETKTDDTNDYTKSVDYIYEPDKRTILDELLPKLLDIKIWRAILESNAAEQAARRIAMDNATRNANDLIKMLDLQYNKARQAAITTEMLEIVGGAEALKNA